MLAKIIAILSLSLLSLSVLCQSKGDVESMLSQFVQNGVINAQQAGDAHKKLNQLTPAQWADIKSRAHQMKTSGQFSNLPTANTLGSASQNIDTSSAQFKEVMNQMKKAIEKRPQ